MENPIVLIADNQKKLDLLIDEKLKQGYLLQGGASVGDNGDMQQIMVLPRTIDGKVTLKGSLPTVGLLIAFICFELWRN